MIKNQYAGHQAMETKHRYLDLMDFAYLSLTHTHTQPNYYELPFYSHLLLYYHPVSFSDYLLQYQTLHFVKLCIANCFKYKLLLHIRTCTSIDLR